MSSNEANSKVELIGTAVFGRSWMAQTARYISEISQRPISRQVIQRWHNDDKIPNWAHSFIKIMAEKRLSELNNLQLNLDNYLLGFSAESKKKA